MYIARRTGIPLQEVMAYETPLPFFVFIYISPVRVLLALLLFLLSPLLFLLLLLLLLLFP